MFLRGMVRPVGCQFLHGMALNRHSYAVDVGAANEYMRRGVTAAQRVRVLYMYWKSVECSGI